MSAPVVKAGYIATVREFYFEVRAAGAVSIHYIVEADAGLFAERLRQAADVLDSRRMVDVVMSTTVINKSTCPATREAVFDTNDDCLLCGRAAADHDLEDDSDREVINAMHRYGGGFVRALATACERADATNLERITEAFPELWRQYEAMAAAKPAEPTCDCRDEVEHALHCAQRQTSPASNEDADDCQEEGTRSDE
jgi:hypothetical protein